MSADVSTSLLRFYVYVYMHVHIHAGVVKRNVRCEIPWCVPEICELLELVRGWVTDEGDGERWREPKRLCFFSGTGVGSSTTSSSGFRLEKNGILVMFFLTQKKYHVYLVCRWCFATSMMRNRSGSAGGHEGAVACI